MNDAENKQFQLVGKCPICSWPQESTGHSSAYSGRELSQSDKDFYLVYSAYYQQNVCPQCYREGLDKIPDDSRHERDQQLSQERQSMGFLLTYTKNPDIVT